MLTDRFLHFIFVMQMRYIHNHISHILQNYKGEMPLANFLKFYFKKNPILGSRDRKIISEMAYCYYRCAKGLSPQTLSIAEQIDLSLLLAESDLDIVRKLLPENIQNHYGKVLSETMIALEQLGVGFNPQQLFPYDIPLSEGILKEEWLGSMLQRPRLFIRVNRKYKSELVALLNKASIPFENVSDACLSLTNGTSLAQVVPEKMYRIQDASSQKTGDYFAIKENETCWDCCCGAGGKSLLAKDVSPRFRLCVSDIRASILDNLAERFNLYNYPIPERVLLSVADAEQTKEKLGNRTFDHIIADVPCSGSGTWGRTPEQLYFFDPSTVKDFSEKQKLIASNALNYVKAGGTMVYITCSVFEAENESVVQHLLAQHPDVSLVQQQLINGIGMGADNMFVAVLQKQ